MDRCRRRLSHSSCRTEGWSHGCKLELFFFFFLIALDAFQRGYSRWGKKKEKELSSEADWAGNDDDDHRWADNEWLNSAEEASIHSIQQRPR